MNPAALVAARKWRVVTLKGCPMVKVIEFGHSKTIEHIPGCTPEMERWMSARLSGCRLLWDAVDVSLLHTLLTVNVCVHACVGYLPEPPTRHGIFEVIGQPVKRLAIHIGEPIKTTGKQAVQKALTYTPLPSSAGEAPYKQEDFILDRLQRQRPLISGHRGLDGNSGS